MTSKSAAHRWGEDRERHLLQNGLQQPHKEVPTLAALKERFLDGYARANRQKPSGIAAKETILNVHLVPLLGTKKLDAITSEDVQRLKNQLRNRAPKTVNNVLTVLNMLLKKGVEWNAIDRMPCTIRLLPIPKPSAGFYDFDEYEQLVDAAKMEPNAYLIVLLGGDAGLRCGEMMALEWRDVDLGKPTALRATVRVEGPCHRPEGRALALRADDRASSDGASGASAFAGSAGALSAGRAIAERRHREASCRTGGAASAPQHERGSSVAPYVLLASRDAGRACTGDSGSGRASGFDDDAVVHAPQPRGDRRRDPATRSAATGLRAWRHLGDGKGR